ncbi:MAG: PEGA domain-containing protein [Spirochaeta sp.]|nr:PEGA domain-containing protein [Spirochaeta sp.]
MKKLASLFIIIAFFTGCATSSGTIYEDTVAAESSQGKGTVAEQNAPEEEKQGLEILSDPEEAEVYLNNSFMGLTPILIEGISRGRYRVTIVKQGFYQGHC